MTEKFISYLREELNYSLHTVSAYANDIAGFSQWLCDGNTDTFNPEDIKANDVRTWMASLSRNKISPRSIRRKIQSLRAFFKYLQKKGLIENNPAEDVILPKIPKRLPDIVRHEEMEQLLDRLKTDSTDCENEDKETKLRNRLIVEIFYTLGIRCSELIAINDDDISFSSSEIKVKGKRSKQRIVPLPMQLAELIKEWISLRDLTHDYIVSPVPLFVNKQGKRISRRQVYTIVNRAMQTVNAKKKSPHALRHSFATAMLNEGAELNSVKEFLGHSSLATTQIYTHISFSEIKKAYNGSHPRSQKNNN